MDGPDLDTRVAGQRSAAHSMETTPPVPAVVLGEVIGRGGFATVGGQPATAGSLPCDQPHAWETYASGTLATAEAPYPADVAADPTLVGTCTKAALQAYLGGASTSGFELDVLPPSTLDWQAGSRGFSCVASRRAARPPVRSEAEPPQPTRTVSVTLLVLAPLASVTVKLTG